MGSDNTQQFDMDSVDLYARVDITDGQSTDTSEIIDEFRNANLYLAGLYMNGVQGFRVNQALERVDELGFRLIAARKVLAFASR